MFKLSSYYFIYIILKYVYIDIYKMYMYDEVKYVSSSLSLNIDKNID